MQKVSELLEELQAIEQMVTFNSMLDRPWEPEPEKFTDDNKTGWTMLNQLSTKPLSE